MLLEAYIIAAAMLGAAVVAIALAVVARRLGPAPGARPFVWMMLACAGWSSCALVEFVAQDLAAKVLWSKLAYLGVVGAPSCWLLFAAQYSSRPPELCSRLRWWLLAAFVPAITLVFVNEWHHQLWPTLTPATGPFGPALVYGHGPLVWVLMVYGYALLLVGTVWLARTMRRAPDQYRGQVVGLLVAVAAPWTASILYMSGVRLYPGLDLTPVGFTISGVALAASMFRFRLLDLVPVARERLFEVLRDGVVVVDDRGRLADFNPAAQALLGTAAQVGAPLEAVLTAWPPLLAACAADAEGPTVVELRGVPDARWIEVAQTALRPERPGCGRVIAWRDITGRRRDEEGRLALQRALHDARHMESLGVLAGGLAHDFNNLLTAIQGNAELTVAMLGRDHPARELLDGVLEGAERAARLTNEMLAYAGRMLVRKERVDVSAMVREARSVLLAEVTPPVVLELALADGLPLVAADPHQLRHALVNLVINGGEAVRGPGVVTVRTRALTADRALLDQAAGGAELAPGAYVALEVSDTGAGMDEATLDKVFEPFVTTKFLGRGLGLPAVLGIARAHGGAVWLTSETGHGTLASILLPVAE